MVERLFQLKENKTTFRTEVLAGVTTFMTMAYILFVQPAVLSLDFAGNPTGLSPEAVRRSSDALPVSCAARVTPVMFSETSLVP